MNDDLILSMLELRLRVRTRLISQTSQDWRSYSLKGQFLEVRLEGLVREPQGSGCKVSGRLGRCQSSSGSGLGDPLSCWWLIGMEGPKL